MQRPVLNPSFLDEPDPPRPRRRWRALRLLCSTGRLLGRALLWQPFPGHLGRPRDTPQPSLGRFCQILLHRLAFAPMILTLLIAALVYRGTHPIRYEPGRTPASLGVYYEPVSLSAEDGQRLEAWLVPAIDARMVVEQKEQILEKQRPGLVLVHDQTLGREQMLPLVRPLHRAGLVVLVLGVRGEGTAEPGASTFGLREAMDVKAAVEMLRRRSFVDADRIGVIGSGTGATAALLAAREDPALAAIVLDSPLHAAEQILPVVGPSTEWLAWMRPMCKWAFELGYGVDAEDVSLANHRQTLDRVPVLMLEPDGGAAGGIWRTTTIAQVERFLHQSLGGAAAGVQASAD